MSERERKRLGIEARSNPGSNPDAQAKRPQGRPRVEDRPDSRLSLEQRAAKKAKAIRDAAYEIERIAEEKARKKEAKKIKALQQRCYSDPKFFYQTVLAPQAHKVENTGKSYAESLGKLHDFMFDFMTFQMDGVTRYSPLSDFLPKLDKNGKYLERWLYWPKLDGPPDIQDGPKGRISRMFYEGERIWRGLLIRIKGNARTKCILMPRSHLKSTLCDQCISVWRIARNPAIRMLIKSLNTPNARSFMEEIKTHFAENPRFKRLYGHLVAPIPGQKRRWNADFIRVNCPERVGKEPTMWAQGALSEVASQHFDTIICDDVVGEKNTQNDTQLKAGCERMQKLQGVRDPNTELIDIGTRWEDSDCHSLFTSKDSLFTERCCFAVATVEDVDFNPIWPEKWSKDDIADKRASMPIDRIFYGQYFNQFAGTSARNFKSEWIKAYGGKRPQICERRKLNIFIGVDAASGLDAQDGKDFTSAVVLGQSDETKRCYVLDGFNERLRAEEVPGAITSLISKWSTALDKMGYGGTLSMGVEEVAWQTYLKVAIDFNLRHAGLDDFHVIPLKHNKVSKGERVRVLAQPYAQGEIIWPKQKRGIWVKHSSTGELYDFLEILREQYMKYPGVQFDDVMDAHAYAYQMTELPDLKRPKVKVASAKPKALPSRQESLVSANENRPDMGAYEGDDEKWGFGVDD